MYAISEIQDIFSLSAALKDRYALAFNIATSKNFWGAICLSTGVILKTADKSYGLFEEGSVIKVKMTRGRRKMGKPGPWNPARATLPWVRGHEWEDLFMASNNDLIRIGFFERGENRKIAAELFNNSAAKYDAQENIFILPLPLSAAARQERALNRAA